MGKYTKVARTLPRINEPDQRYQDRVNAKKDEIVAAEPLAAVRPAWLCDRIADVKRQIKAINAAKSALDLELTALVQLGADAFEREDVTSLTLDGGVRVEIGDDIYASVTDRDAYREWCIKEGLLRSMMLPPATTTSLIKNALINGQPEPPGIKAFWKKKARIVGLGGGDDDDAGTDQPF